MTGSSTISPENKPPQGKPVKGGASPVLPLYLALAGTVMCIFILRIIFRDKHILSIIIVLLIAGCFYAPLVYFLAVKKVRMPTPVFIAVLIASAVLRFIFIGSEPEVLSDDVYRYLWDGKVQTEGINPYRYPPASGELSHLRDKEVYPLINHKGFHTSYPPVSQLIFRAAYTLGRGRLFAFRLFYLVFEGLIILFLLLYDRKLRDRLLIYLLCPLVIVEVHAGLHIDIAGAALLAGGWFFFSKRRYYLFILFFTLSVLTKYFSIAAGPLFIAEYLRRQVRGSGLTARFGLRAAGFRAAGFRRAGLQRAGDLLLKLGAAAAIGFIAFLPFLRNGEGLFRQARIYAYYWEFNGGVYSILRAVLGTETARWAKFLPIAAAAGTIAVYPGMTVEDRLVLTLMSFFVLSSTVYPWYLIWFIPYFVLRINKGELSLAVLISLSYYVLIRYKSEGIWEDRPLFLFLQYIPFFALFFHDILRGRYVQKK